MTSQSSTTDDRIHGECNCGAIKISIQTSQFPTRCTMCHCLNCRASSVEVTGNTRVWTDKAESGRSSDRHFCGDCGSPIMTVVRERPSNTFVKGGLFKKFGVNLPEPWAQLFVRRREPWEVGIEGVHELN
ncbi:hypothetical protein D0Z07_3896 [Hyphodiscus hymeniophilus]|uniref:CENP-V/GFA domain-containing protein n=1 Tax=Hyphodiscus hymeniophilus TaxID=353542 RepID=A0A9P6VLP1_9HELO|nr:hypothetical protein D0Z07_3896 [Hyphodiscus hymeniophilus]